MTMSDRIAVMHGGVVEQLASPRELYQRPASAFVAGFIGTSNLVTMRVDGREGGLLVMDLGEGERILAVDPGPGSEALGPTAGGVASGCTITVRPEWIKVEGHEAGARAGASHVGGTVVDVVYLGSVTQLIVILRTGERLTVHRLNDEVGTVEPRPGDRVILHWDAAHSFVIGTPRAATAGSPPAPSGSNPVATAPQV
jgi:spermidine/putrescine transport system ATP-binding protein